MKKTADDVLKFVDYLENKSFIPKNTAQGKKAAIIKFVDGLSQDEQSVDNLLQNFDTYLHRFKNKNTGEIQGSSLETYKSRARATLEDFVAWIDDSSSWEKKFVAKKSSGKAVSGSQKTASKQSERKSDTKPESQATESKPGMRRLTFPLSEETEVTVEFPIKGLTMSELQHLGMFLAPYCQGFTAKAAARWPMIDNADE
jgi:hypothetical protein